MDPGESCSESLFGLHSSLPGRGGGARVGGGDAAEEAARTARAGLVVRSRAADTRARRAGLGGGLGGESDDEGPFHPQR